MQLSHWTFVLLISWLVILGIGSASFAVGPSKMIYDFSTQPDISKLKANNGAISIVPVDGGSALSLATEAGKQFPGVSFTPDNGTWDLSSSKALVATVANPGTDPLTVSMRVDNEGEKDKNPWSAAAVEIAPGATQRLQVVFGQAYGKAAYPLDPAKITGILIYLGGPAQPTSRTVLIKKIEAFAKVQPPPDPADLKPNMSGLVMWLDASDESLTQTDAEHHIVKWLDRSGQHHDVTAAAGGGPGLVEDAIQGRSVARFTGQQLLTLAESLRKTSGSATIVVVSQPLKGAKHATGERLFVSQSDANKPVEQAPNFVMVAPTDTAGRSINFVEQGNVPIGPIAIGGNLSGDIAEILVYDRAFLSEGERQSSLNYLSTKWHVAIPETGWTRKGDLGQTPKRVTDALPLSDQANQGQWWLDADFSDEFKGATVDEKKWRIFSPETRQPGDWLGRAPALFHRQNVAVRDGELQLTFRKGDVPEMKDHPDYHDYTSAYITTQARTGYGYYEICATPMNSAASSSFWLTDTGDRDHASEIDIFELGGKGKGFERNYNMTIHVWSMPNDKRHWGIGGVWHAPWNLVDDYHVYGFDWTKDQLTWYVDGVAVHTAKNTNWFLPMKMIFDSEAMWSWFGHVEDADLPSTFKIKYVRVWRQAPGAAPVLPDTRPSATK